MGWESDQEAVEITTDRSRWVLFGIVGLVVVMTILLAVTHKTTHTVSVVRVYHILKLFEKGDEAGRQKAWDEIVEVKRLIDEGANFKDMAKKHSDDHENRDRGGDLGWVEHDALVEEFEAYIWKAEVGSVSDPIETVFGFHLIYIEERSISDAELYDRNLNERVQEMNQ